MRRARSAKAFAICACAVVLIGGCGRVVNAPVATAAPDVAPAPDSEVARATAFAARLRSERAAVLAEIGRLEYAAHRDLLHASGLEVELGGVQATDHALLALMLDMRRVTAEWQPPRWTAIQNASADGSLGVAQAAVELTGLALGFDDLYGQGEPVKHESSTDQGVAHMEIADGTIDYRSTLVLPGKDLNGKFATSMKVNVCPDAAGKLRLELTSKSSLSRPGGGGGTNLDINVVVTRQLDDDAHYVGLERQTHVEHASFGGANAGTYVDLTRSLGGDRPGTTINRRSTQATDASIANAGDLAAILELMAVVYTETARDVWESGACVKLDPTAAPSKRTKAQPSTSFSLLAAPRSRVDGSATGGTVRATLSGDSSLAPAGSKVRADARFTYVAPGERKRSAKIAFEARSMRGVGKSELGFDTDDGAAYAVEGGADEFHGTGQICDLAAPFTIAGSGNTVRFAPRDARGGTYEYSGTMSGFAVFGNGTYVVKYANEIAVGITATGAGSVRTPQGVVSANGTEQYRLTPAPDCGTSAPSGG